MGRERAFRQRQLASRRGSGRVIDTTGDLPVVAPRPATTSAEWHDAGHAAPDELLPGEPCYAPRPRVTARPLGRPIAATLLAEPIAEPIAEPLSEPLVVAPRRPMARRPMARFTATLTSRLRPNTPGRRRALLVYLVVALVVVQALVGALTPLGRSERQTFSSALSAVAPVVSTPFPTGPTPQPVSSPAAFIQTMLPYAEKAHQDLGWPTSVVLAQMGMEHGWRFPDFDGWNLANSRPFPDPNGDGGVCYGQRVVRNFCYAPTPWIGLAIYEHCAHLSYYRGVAAAARTGGAGAAARALGQSPWDAGHYTVDSVPGDTLLNAMKTFNLYQYDQ